MNTFKVISPTPSSTTIPTSSPTSSKYDSKKKHQEDRLESFPESLSLEMVTDLVDKLAKTLSKLPPDQADKLQKYLDFVCQFVKEVKDECVESNIRLIGSTIQTQFYVRLKSKNLDMDDAFQEGAMGLLTAAFLYDPSRGYAFSTYATWWIQCFLRKLLTKAYLIHIPPYLNNPSTLQDQNLPANYFQRWEEAKRARKIKSITVGIGGFTPDGRQHGKDLQISDMEQDSQSSNMDDRLDVEDLLKYLNPVERRIVELRYLQGLTLEETTRALFREGVTPIKVTKERIRQRERRAIKTLKEHVHNRRVLPKRTSA